MRLRLCILALCLLTSACTGERDAAQPDGGLPAFPDSHRKPSLATITLLGREAAATSPDALAVGDDMLIPSTTGSLNWAVYELTPGERPLVLEVWLRDAQTSEAWVALADFAAGRWELRGPIESHELFVLDRARHLSQSGSVHAAVIVTGQNYALVEKLEIIEREPPVANLTVSKDWGEPGEEITLDASGSYSPDGSVEAYQWDFIGDEVPRNEPVAEPTIAFNLPDPPNYQQVGVWVIDDAGVRRYTSLRVSSLKRRLDQDLSFDTLGGVRIVDGHPSVLYLTYSTVDETKRGLFFRRALDPDGINWGEAQQLASSTGLGRQPALEIIGGRPAVVYGKDELVDTIYYMRALDAAGSQWPAPLQAAPTDFLLGRNAFEEINGLPAMLVQPEGAPSYSPAFVIADDVDGTTWKAPVSVGQTGPLGYGGYVLKQLGGVPVCFFGQYSVRSQDPLGQAWDPAVPIHSGSFPRVDLNHNGHPLLMYFSSNVVLQYSYSQNTSGSGFTAPFPVIEPVDAVLCDLRVIRGKPWVALTNFGGPLHYRKGLDEYGTSWAALEQLNLTCWDCELVEIQSGAAVVYTADGGATQDLWFDRLETLP